MATSSSTMSDVFNPAVSWLSHFITSHSVLWFSLLLLIVVISILNFLSKVIPQFDLVKSKLLLPLSNKFQGKRLVKAAIKSDISGHINLEIREIQKHLPKGWLKEFDIEWVTKENQENFIDDERVVLRMRPVSDQNRNFVNATYHFFKQIIFPKTQSIIPEGHIEGTVLYMCRKAVARKGNETKVIFEDEILEPAVQKHKQLPKYLEDYETLDKHGYFTGTFLRELHIVAREVRFKPQRSNVGQEAAGIIKHIKDFINQFAQETGIPSSGWYNITNVSRYGLLLVAHPSKTSSGIDAYIKRVREKLSNGANRVYVFGTKSEESFFNAVIAGIVGTIEDCELMENFITLYDYRGNPDGLGAVFIRKSIE